MENKQVLNAEKEMIEEKQQELSDNMEDDRDEKSGNSA